MSESKFMYFFERPSGCNPMTSNVPSSVMILPFLSSFLSINHRPDREKYESYLSAVVSIPRPDMWGKMHQTLKENSTRRGAVFMAFCHRAHPRRRRCQSYARRRCRPRNLLIAGLGELRALAGWSSSDAASTKEITRERVWNWGNADDGPGVERATDDPGL